MIEEDCQLCKLNNICKYICAEYCHYTIKENNYDMGSSRFL